jgi:predicted transcriptional regulator
MTEATVDEIAGFIMGNVKRKQILDVLDKNGSETLVALRKLTRMPKLMLEKVLNDMVERGVVIKQQDSFILTENGKKAASVLPRQKNKASGQRFESNIPREI